MRKVNNFITDQTLIFSLFLIFPILSYLGVSGKYTIVSLLFLFVYWYLSSYVSVRKISYSYPLILWLLLTLYHWINAMIKGVPEVDFYDLLHGLKIYACIVIFTFFARKDFDNTIRSLLICFNLYLILAFVFNNLMGTNHNGRLSGVIFATALGQAAALTGVFVAYYSVRKNLHILFVVSLYLLPLIIILQTQTRNSLAMLLIIILGHLVSSLVKRGVEIKKNIPTLLLVCTLVFSGILFVFNNTELGGRLLDTETAVTINTNNDYQTGSVLDDVAGDRLIYYVLGWKYFTDSPITGIGMWNFMYVSQGDYPLHSEFMIHLAEGGIIAAVIWIIFMIVIFKGVLQSNKPKYLKILAVFSLLQILFCGLYARVFYYEIFYPVIGIIISLTKWGRNLK